jgi:hypoxanthine phosphoribosyltransferase
VIVPIHRRRPRRPLLCDGPRMPRGSPGTTLVDAATIAAGVARLATEIDQADAGATRPLVLVCVLKGSLIFTADLARALTVPVEIDTVAVRSYGSDGQRTGTVELIKDIGITLRDRDVLLVEDIVDTGMTTSFLRDHLLQHQPRSLRLVALLDKQAHRIREVVIDFCGFVIPDRFVVGYRLDLDERWRELPDIHALGDA